MSIEGLLEEARWNAGRYANYQPMHSADALYDIVKCGGKAGTSQTTGVCGTGARGTLANQVADARRIVDNALSSTPSSEQFVDTHLRHEIDELKKENAKLSEMMKLIQAKVSSLELRSSSVATTPTSIKSPPAESKPAPAASKGNDDDEDIDLFGSDDEEDEEKDRLTKERVAAYAAKKSKKPELIAKSSVLFDVKPWDDETDLGKMEAAVRSITMDGLLWGAAKLVPVGYGIKKLQILCIVEDEKVSTEELSERIAEEFEDFVQSVDIAAFNKI